MSELSKDQARGASASQQVGEVDLSDEVEVLQEDGEARPKSVTPPRPKSVPPRPAKGRRARANARKRADLPSPGAIRPASEPPPPPRRAATGDGSRPRTVPAPPKPPVPPAPPGTVARKGPMAPPPPPPRGVSSALPAPTPPTPRSPDRAVESPPLPPVAPQGAPVRPVAPQSAVAPPAAAALPLAALAPRFARELPEPIDRLSEAPTRMLQGLEAMGPKADESTLDYRRRCAFAFVETCRSELRSTPRGTRAGRLHYEIARHAECPLFDVELASSHYESAYQMCPEHLPSLRGARRTMIAKGEASSAVALFDAEVALTRSARDRAMLLLEKGILLQSALSQPDPARAAFAQARKLAPSDVSVLRASLLAEWRAADWSNVSAILEALAAQCDDSLPERAAFLAAQARVVGARQRRPEQSVERYAEALRVAPGTSGVSRALEALLYAGSRWKQLAELLVEEAARRSDVSARSQLLAQAARIHSQWLGEHTLAGTLLEQAYQLTPADSAILRQMETTYERAQDVAAVCRTLERVVHRTESVTEKATLLHRMGMLARERLGDDRQALAHHKRALSIDPSFRPSIDAAIDILRASDAHEEVVALLLEDGAAAGETTRRVGAYAMAADICEHALSRPQDAERCHRLALELDPRHQPSFAALARLMQQRQDWVGIVELYERGLEHAADEQEKVSYLMRMGLVQEEALNAPEQAAQTYRRALSLAPRRIDALRALQRVAERAGRWRDVYDAMELEVAVWPDGATQASLLQRMGQISELHIGDDDQAQRCYEDALVRVPGYAAALVSLGELESRRGHWDRVASVLSKRLAVATAPETQASLCCTLASLHEEQLGDPARALEYFQQALEVDPTLASARRSTLRILSDGGQWEQVVKVLEQEFSTTEDPSERGRIALRIAEVCEDRLHHQQRALSAYERAATADPSLVAAAQGKARLLEQGDDAERLAADLERRAGATADPDGRRADLFRAGQVWRDQVHDLSRATQAFAAIFADVPEDPSTQIALEQLYAETGQWSELARVLQAASRTSSSKAMRVASLRALATTFELRGGGDSSNLDLAIAQLLREAPDDLPALAARERFAVNAKDAASIQHVDQKLGSLIADPVLASAYRTRLAEALEAAGDAAALDYYRSALEQDPDNLGAARGITRVARGSGSPELLVQAARNEAEILRDVPSAVELLVVAAGLLRHQGMGDRAADALEEALRLEPASDAVRQALTELLSELGQHARLADRLGAAACTMRGDAAARLWSAVARIQADRVGDNGAALMSLGRALAENAHFPDALLYQAEVYCRGAQWREAADALRTLLARKQPDAVAARAHFELARILAGELDQGKTALVSVDSLLALEPSHKAGLALAVELRRRFGDYSGARTAVRELARMTTTGEERARVLVDYALIERDSSSADAAAEAFRAAVREVGVAAGAALEFRRWAERQPGPARLVRLREYADALSEFLAAESEDRAALEQGYLELARTLAGPLANSERAAATLRRALSQLPESTALRDDLAAYLAASGHADDAVRQYLAVLSRAPLSAARWRSLSRAYAASGRPQLAAMAIGPIVALGQATQQEVARVVPGRAPTGQERLAPVLPSLLATVPDDAGANAVAAALLPGLHKLAGADIETYGVSAREKLTARAHHPVRALADRLAAVVGAPEFDLYVHQQPRPCVDLELTETPSIMVPQALADMDELSLTFLLARPLAALATGFQVAECVDPDVVRMWFAGALFAVNEVGASVLEPGNNLSAESKRLYKAIPWLSRRALEDAARAFDQSADKDVLAWVHRARVTNVLIAAVLVGDLEVALRLLRYTDGDLAPGGVAPADGERLIGETLCFVLTDEAIACRRTAGLA